MPDLIEVLIRKWREAEDRLYEVEQERDEWREDAQEAASLHVLVSRLESRLDSTRGELERTRERLREVEQERDEWREEAWRCYVESGADPDGDDARHLSPGEAIRAVRELRADHHAACDEAEWAHAGWTEALAKLAQLKQSVEMMAEWPCDGEPGPRCPDLGKPEELDHGWCPSCRARDALASLDEQEGE